MFAAVVSGMSAQASPFERAMDGHYTGGGVPVAMPGNAYREGAPRRYTRRADLGAAAPPPLFRGGTLPLLHCGSGLPPARKALPTDLP